MNSDITGALFKLRIQYEYTRGSNFWPSKVCEGGSHVMHMHADLLLHPIRTNKGGSKVKFRTIYDHVIDKLFEFSLLIQFEQF